MRNLWNNFIKMLKDERGFIIPALISAAAGFGLSKLRKKPKKQTIAPSIKPFTSQTEFAVGKSLNETILAGLRGEGRGFGKEFVERTTSPFVRQRLADLPQEQRDIQEGFSGRGFGRSVLAGQRVGEARSQAGRDINQLIAQAELTNLQQQKADEARQIASGQTFATQEVGTRATAAQFDLNTLIQQAKQANLFQDKLSQQRDIEIGLPLKLAGQALGGGFGGIGGAGGAGIGQSLPGGGIDIGGGRSVFGPGNVPTGFEGKFQPRPTPFTGGAITQGGVAGSGFSASDLEAELRRRGLR